MKGLIERLEENLPFFEIFKRVTNSSIKIWEHPVLQNFTDHGPKHSERLIEIMDDLLSFWDGFNLNDSEILILLCSAYLHDIGMQAENIALGNADILRENHAEYSCNLILKDGVIDEKVFLRHRSCGFRDDNDEIIDYPLITTTAMVCKGHSGRYFDEVMEFFNSPQRNVLGNSVDGKFLTALLMIADELHLEGRSLVEPNIHYPTISRLHHKKHQRIDKPEFSFAKHTQEIRVSLKFEFFDDELDDIKKILITWVVDKLSSQFIRVKDIFRQKMYLSFSNKINVSNITALSNARFPYRFDDEEKTQLTIMTTEMEIYNRFEEQDILKEIIKDREKKEIYFFYNASKLDIVTLFKWFEHLGQNTKDINFSALNIGNEGFIKLTTSMRVTITIELINKDIVSVVLIEDVGDIQIDDLKAYIQSLLNNMSIYKHSVKVVLVSTSTEHDLGKMNRRVIKKELGNFSEETIKKILELKNKHTEKSNDNLAKVLYNITKGNPQDVKEGIEGLL